ncbi:MAG: hypothetical protein A2Z34_05670 [Planctomycetes bacterium RBG_16_59_8]|nr:MAG: hypothetical protein A2Z34_05670 [Planctomycetes bacterium RBG_16_59_8]
MKLTVRKAKEPDTYKDIARIPEAHRKDCKGNPIPSGSIGKLTINGKSKYLIMRGNDDEKNPVLSLDEYCRQKLDVRNEEAADVRIDFPRWWLPRWWAHFRWAWSATDPAYRLPVKISIILGGIGIALGIISLL